MLNKKDLEVVSNHHYVWAKYMRRWSLNNRDVFYTTKKTKKIDFTSVRNIAVERYFYKLSHLTERHIECIKFISSPCDKEQQKHHLSYLSNFLEMQKKEEVYKKSGKVDHTIEQYFEAQKSKGLEQLHTAHENHVQHILEALANRDLDILNTSENVVKFMIFVGHQFTRTKTFKESIITKLKSSTDFCEIASSMDECWWFISYMFGMNLGKTLIIHRNQETHSLLINDSDIPFITSDHPVVNVHNELTDDIRAPDDHQFDLYYPISPDVAYLIHRSNRFDKGKVHVSTLVVNELNEKIAKNASSFIISTSKESLKPYVNKVGSRLRSILR
ncbi:DUF4238 domain-containing protein [Enterovibrio norvegicus]|uniref:DUF4238 domain-containing protein n=1 Tax=Enterovibrio norvegicus TaxID=188144 RepID=UPI00352EC7DB